MFTLEKDFEIYGAHYLKDQGGLCADLHGHTYIITLKIVDKNYSADTKMLIDTYKLKEIFWNKIPSDHLNLNEFFESENATMEFIAKKLYEMFKPEIPNLNSVVVHETQRSRCEYDTS